MKNIFFGLAAWLSFAAFPVAADFVIAAKSSCAYGANSYSYQIGPSVLYSDLRVLTGPSVLYPDMRIRVVSDPSLASLIFVDDTLLSASARTSVDMGICKQTLYADKKIQAGPSVLYPDIRVLVGEGVLFQDHTLFFRSDLFTLEEAAALFPAIWKFNEN
ncbi:hypothetical protein N9L80_02765 [Luminiphilus sp.]|nr:hypothetical protein [Luminiphilus sp.]